MNDDGTNKTTWSVPTANAGPKNIILGPDGNMWYTEYCKNRITRINKDTYVQTEFILPTGAKPDDLVVGPAGSNTIWFTDEGLSQFGMLGTNPPNTIVEYPTATPNASPRGIVNGPSGSFSAYMFIAEARVDKIGWIDTANPTLHKADCLIKDTDLCTSL